MVKQANQVIKIGDLQKASNLLKSSLADVKKIQDDPPKSRILSQIFNSFGNLFKKAENWEESLNFFEKCIQLERHLRDEEKGFVALAYLSAGAVYSKISNHNTSIKYGNVAIALMKKLIKLHPKLVNSLVIAYYNVANEYKYIGEVSKADQMLRTALTLSKDRMGITHPLTETIQKSLISAFCPKANKENLNFKSNPFSRKSITSKKRSNSGNCERSNRLSLRRKLENQPFKEFFESTYYSISRGKSGSDEDSFKKCNSGSNWSRRIDVQKHKETERRAAVIVQSWWRGVCAREVFREMKMKEKLCKAELRARKAVEDYEKIKVQVARTRRVYRKN